MKKGKTQILAQNKRLNKKFWNDTELKQALFEKKKKKKESCVQYFKCFFLFYICRFSIFYVHREEKKKRKKKGYLGIGNWQACTVVYATVKYLLYHLYIAKQLNK